ncbi:MAG: glycosyltransferase family 2 protein [Chloroflexota bacterium]|nr:MAG: glycosyltransferase family 2 protein [Chloroflexota bacterium]
MYRGKSVAVVVPAFNEETQIAQVLGTMPAFVDEIIVIDDCSRDRTAEIVESWHAGSDRRVTLFRHRERSGVGGAIATGYRQALDCGSDIVAVMAGDGQMPPEELPTILDPIVEERADYAKGNRLFSGEAWRQTPRPRYLGNAVLSLLTKIASGYWHVADSQSGYTAIARRTLAELDLNAIYPRYGVPNDLLIKLNVIGARVADVPIRAIYGIGERSKMRIWSVTPTIALLLFRGFLWRLFHRYVIRDFHPLVFFYAIGALLVTVGVGLGSLETFLKITTGNIAIATVVLVALLIISGGQMLLFAMWFDMEYNRDLRAR